MSDLYPSDIISGDFHLAYGYDYGMVVSIRNSFGYAYVTWLLPTGEAREHFYYNVPHLIFDNVIKITKSARQHENVENMSVSCCRAPDELIVSTR